LIAPTCIECGEFCQASSIAGLVKCENCGRLQPGKMPEPVGTPNYEDALSGYDGAIEVPDYSDVMVGWRAWQVNAEQWDEKDIWLRSITHSKFTWTPREPLVAVCDGGRGNGGGAGRAKARNHEPPEPGCTCGVYAARTREHLVSMSYHVYNEDATERFCVIGTVSMWGGVIPGTQGWKSGIAYPRELIVPYEAYHLVKPLQEAYGVPTRLENILKTPNIIQH
jgi:hypothetical protein